MKLVLFSKFIKNDSASQLIKRAHELEIDGYDFCVRPGGTVNPDNMETMLAKFVKDCRKENVQIPMVTAWGGLLDAKDERASKLLKAMDASDVRLLKLGYFHFKRQCDDDYWDAVDRVRAALEKWQELSRVFNIKLCYHTHSTIGKTCFMGTNCSSLMHLLHGFDPKCLSAYIDTGHMSVEGESFDLGVSIVRPYLSAVALKDVFTEPDKKTGGPLHYWCRAGHGIVDWKLVFSELKRINFKGPLSIHTEYDVKDEKELSESLPAEVAFYRQKIRQGNNL